MLQSIEDAQQRGEFNHLSGSGKPLPKRTDTTVPVGLSGTQVMAQKAEFEMRRAIHNQELSDLAGQGEALPYKGTSVTGAEISQQQGGGGGLDVVSDFVMKESKLSAEDLKKL